MTLLTPLALMVLLVLSLDDGSAMFSVIDTGGLTWQQLSSKSTHSQNYDRWVFDLYAVVSVVQQVP